MWVVFFEVSWLIFLESVNYFWIRVVVLFIKVVEKFFGVFIKDNYFWGMSLFVLIIVLEFMILY